MCKNVVDEEIIGQLAQPKALKMLTVYKRTVVNPQYSKQGSINYSRCFRVDLCGRYTLSKRIISSVTLGVNKVGQRWFTPSQVRYNGYLHDWHREGD